MKVESIKSNKGHTEFSVKSKYVVDGAPYDPTVDQIHEMSFFVLDEEMDEFKKEMKRELKL